MDEEDNINELFDLFPKEFKEKYEKLNEEEFNNIENNKKPYDIKISSIDKKYINQSINEEIKKINYYENFELFSESIFNIFLSTQKQNDIIEKKNFIVVPCIIGDKKIILCLKENDNYFFNVCNYENDNIITEMIIISKENIYLNKELNIFFENNEYMHYLSNNNIQMDIKKKYWIIKLKDLKYLKEKDLNMPLLFITV